jgi:SAM-dependent methyltransferase
MPADAPGDGEQARVDAADAARIQQGYGTYATVYDWFARLTAPVGGVRGDCVDALDLSRGDTVVEFGCGPGVNLSALREAVGPEGRVVGVDITGAMLRRARTRVERHGWENVSLVRGDATAPPVRAADAVLATFVTSLFEAPYPVVARWCALADTVAVTNFAPGHSRVGNAALWAFARASARLFDAAGTDVLDQLAERTAASRRALADHTDAVDVESYVLGTVTLAVGRR